jgi:predicted house-cleaning noncanonical NTP pyrophosphatase (MazG superfamily)
VTVSKLVRDKIPQIIRDQGLEPVTYTAGPAEYAVRLRDKLAEEVAEFRSGADLAELTDILDVVYALAALAGISPQQLEEMRAVKAEQRGGFGGRVIWSGNRPATRDGSC